MQAAHQARLQAHDKELRQVQALLIKNTRNLESETKASREHHARAAVTATENASALAKLRSEISAAKVGFPLCGGEQLVPVHCSYHVMLVIGTPLLFWHMGEFFLCPLEASGRWGGESRVVLSSLACGCHEYSSAFLHVIFYTWTAFSSLHRKPRNAASTKALFARRYLDMRSVLPMYAIQRRRLQERWPPELNVLCTEL